MRARMPHNTLYIIIIITIIVAEDNIPSCLADVEGSEQKSACEQRSPKGAASVIFSTCAAWHHMQACSRLEGCSVAYCHMREL
jgi:hypothetical protein